MDHHQRFGQPVRGRSLSQGTGQDIRVQVPGRAVAIQKDRNAALVDNRVGGRDEGQRGTEHFIAGAGAR